MNPMRDKNKAPYRGGEGTTPLLPQLVQKKIAEGKTSYELKKKKLKGLLTRSILDLKAGVRASK